MKPCENLLVLFWSFKQTDVMILKENKVEFHVLPLPLRNKCTQEIGFPWAQTYLNIQYLRHPASITSPNQRAAVVE